MLRMIHAFNRIVFTQEKTQYSHVHNKQAEQRNLFFLMCFSDSLSNHSARGVKGEFSISDYDVFLFLIRLSWVNGRIGSNPVSHGCATVCAPSPDTSFQ